jgi:menaquinone-dependent protoporphyrinogen oxidase
MQDPRILIVGSPILLSRHLAKLPRFVHDYRDVLNDLPSAFFSVSGFAASKSESGRDVARQCATKFEEGTGWRPTLAESFGGAMAFTKYNPTMRWVMTGISKRRGGPTVA